MSPREIMLAQFARGVDPSSGGRQMPGHYGIADRNILSVSSPVATQILHATGIAWAAKLKKTEQVTITYLGEGSSNQGDFHEALNFAGIHKLPVIYVVENNGYAISVPTSLQSAVAGHRHPGAGYNMPGVIVDGADVLACYARRPRGNRPRAKRRRADADRGQGHPTDRPLVGRPAHQVPQPGRARRTRRAATRCRSSATSYAPRACSTTRPEEQMLAESRKVVEDATDWAEAQADPGSGHCPAPRLRRMSRRRGWTIRCGRASASSATAGRAALLKGDD